MQVPGHRPGASQAPTVTPSPRTNASQGKLQRSDSCTFPYCRRLCRSQRMNCGQVNKVGRISRLLPFPWETEYWRMVPEFPGVCHDQRWGADGGFSFLHLTWFLHPRCTPSDAVWSACTSFCLDPSRIRSLMHQVTGSTAVTRDYSTSM